MTRNDLLETGFKEYKFSTAIHPYAVAMLQKRYRDERGIKYHITAYEYDFSDIENYPGEPIRFQYENQFILSDDERINISSVGWNNYTIDQIEEQFESIWIKLNCKYYELND